MANKHLKNYSTVLVSKDKLIDIKISITFPDQVSRDFCFKS